MPGYHPKWNLHYIVSMARQLMLIHCLPYSWYTEYINDHLSCLSEVLKSVGILPVCTTYCTAGNFQDRQDFLTFLSMIKFTN